MAVAQRSEEFDPSEFYRSSDMALATYLKICGHDPQRVYWDSATCYWVFRMSDSLEDQLELFHRGDSRVDPKEFTRVFTQTKREFYDTNPDERHNRR